MAISWAMGFSLMECPYSHLAIEKKLLEGNFEEDCYLFIYRNRPSVVFGRFQCPYVEINFDKLNSLSMDIELVRRFSGGGCVYHDLGNWNFSIIRKTRELNRKENLELIQDIFIQLGVKLHINERFDLLYQKSEDQKFYKVSGSAFKQKKETSLHHGTLLIDADLSALSGVLGRQPGLRIESKAVASKPSRVFNLAQEHTLEWHSFITHVQEYLNVRAEIIDSTYFFDSQMSEWVDELKSWNWRVAEGPNYFIEHQDFSLKVVKGLIDAPIINGEQTKLKQIKMANRESLSEIVAYMKKHHPNAPRRLDELTKLFLF